MNLQETYSRFTVLPAAALLLAIGAFPAAAAESEGYPANIPVSQFISPSNVTINGDIVRLGRKVTADAKGIVTLEAEEADKLMLQVRGPHVAEDAKASNGGYIHFVDRADYSFQIEKGGKFQTWYRVFFPFKASWNHGEAMDGKQETVIDSANNQPGEKWLWLKGPVYELKPGRHTFELNGYYGGARIDKIVFAPDLQFEPKDLGPASSYAEAPAKGRVETPGFVPAGLKKWSQLEWKATGNGGIVEAFYSRDLGKTWTAVPKDGKLTQLPISDEGYNGIKLAFDLKASPTGATPFLQAVQLEYLGPAPTILENDRIRLAFSPSGELLKIQNRKTGQACSIPAMRSDLLGITVLANGGLQPLSPTGLVVQKLESKDGGTELHQRRLFGTGQVEAEIVIRLGKDELSAWKLKLVNRGDLPIVHVDFPRLNGVRVGERGDDDFFFIPKVNGNVYRNPSQSKNLFSDSACYPRGMAYKYVTLWDATGGLYLASLDSTFRDTGIYVNKSDETSLKVDFRKWMHLDKDETWQSPEYVVAAYEGDWHWAADQYRQWFEQLKIPDLTTRWVREEFDAWDTRTGLYYNAQGYYGLIRMFETSAPLGYATVMSNRQGFDSNVGWCSLAPAVNPTWGTETEFAQGNLGVQERGGHTFFYINWHLWNRAYSSGTRIGGSPRKLWPAEAPFLTVEEFDRNGARHPNGAADKEIPHAIYEEHVLCRAATGSTEYFTGWSRYYTGRYRATGIYWDTLNDGYQACYATDHGHADLGQWEQGSRRALEEEKKVGQAIDPHYACMGEGICSVFLHGAVDLVIASNNFASHDVARYTSPHSILVGGAWDSTSPPREEMLEDMHYQFLMGSRFMGGTWDEEAGRILKLRRAVKQLLYPARYRDTVGLALDLPPGAEPRPRKQATATGEFSGAGFINPPANGIMARHLRLERPGSKVTLVNLLNTPNKDGATCAISKQECPRMLAAWVADQEAAFKLLAVTDAGEAWKFAVPSGTQSVALLVEECEPLIDVEAPAYVPAGETVPVTVRVRNLNPTRFWGTVQIESVDGFKAGSASFKAIPPGEVQTVTVQLTAPSLKAPKRCDLDAVVKVSYDKEWKPPKAARRLFWIYVGQPARLTIRESTTAARGVDVIVENMSSQPIKGACESAANEFVGAGKADFEVAPKASRTVVVPMKELKPFDMPLPVTVKIRYGKVERDMVQSLTPLLVNGGFEVDLAGDRYPDGWAFYGPGGIHGMLRYDQVALDSEIKHSGKYSLRLPPIQSTGANVGISLRSRALVGHSYRVKAAVRREKEGPVSITVSGVGITKCAAVGQWETFEGVVPAQEVKGRGPGTQTDCMATIPVVLHNGSQGSAWFDSLTIEEVAK